ncbi:Phosphoglycolate phosphatase [Pseudomonas syringae pv. actinidiae]|uniref:Phosphoglycolate phosphatase n=1 Tax=Pseudomonas syringae pv. actinidiae TaxID=103796 RepID=A0AAN4TK95_PSESF|nr:Phosphoglycolate phosphatase [Pseudomonas syringae pv. actinidiae]
MTTHAVVHHTPDDKVVTLQNMLSRIGTIFGLKFDNPIHHEEPLADRLRIIERCYDDLTVLCIAATVDDDQILIKNACSNHAVSEDLSQVHMRCTHLGHFIQRDVLLDVIDSWRGEPSWHLKRIQRQLDTPFRQWTKNDYAHEDDL